MCKFKCGKNCPHCEWYEPGGYYYESDCEGFRDEGCNIDQNPETCTKYEPTYVQSLLDEIEELKTELEKFKKIDEEKLNELAMQSYPLDDDSHWNLYQCERQEAFKVGYRKAKEE